MTDKLFMDVKDVTKILEVSDGKAYKRVSNRRYELFFLSSRLEVRIIFEYSFFP